MQKPQKLFIDASPLATRRVSGIPHFTAELVRALDQHPDNGTRFELVLVITPDKKKRLERWGYKAVSYKYIPLPMRGLNFLWNRNLLPPMDLILGHGTYLFPNYRNWPLALSKSRSLTYIHDLTYLHHPEFVQPKNLAFLKRNIGRWIRRANLILTGSEYTSQEIVDVLNVDRDKVITVYHGVNQEVYYPRSDQEITVVKKTHGIAGKYLLYIGSLEPRKNLQRLIRAYRALPKPLSDEYALCIVGGGGWLNDDILAAIKQAKNDGYNIIKPDQYIEDDELPALLSGAALLVHPALYEGFGLSPLQAMACGTPVLVGNNSSLPEVVGSAGILVDATSEQDISDKIQDALADKARAKTMRDAGLRQAKKFNWKTSADQIVTFLTENPTK